MNEIEDLIDKFENLPGSQLDVFEEAILIIARELRNFRTLTNSLSNTVIALEIERIKHFKILADHEDRLDIHSGEISDLNG